MRQPNDDRFNSGRRCNRFSARLTVDFIWPALIAALLSAMPAPASAKIEVEGQSDTVRLMAEDASLNEVLAALSAKFNLTYTSEPELDRVVAGAYLGTLQQVLARILIGYDYVANVSVDSIELKVLGRSGSVARPSGLPPAPAIAAGRMPIAPPVFNPRPTASPGEVSLRSRTPGQ